MVTRARFRVLVLIGVLLLTASSAWAQMDMLPQVFRDLPPELQQGLPEQMSFAEYRALNRNVDFFTMFMSIFIPGYGLFEVERPDLAWPVAGARIAGYGMMAASVAFQWDHFYALAQDQALSAEDFQRLLVNGFIFGGGVIVAGLSWATDVVLAYHIANHEKDLVQYTYGLRSSIYGGIRGGTTPSGDERYLRRLLEQQADEALVELLLAELTAYARRYPDERFSGEALFFAALLHAETHSDADAVRLALRSAYLYPRGPRTDDALRLVARLIERNRVWSLDYEQARSLVGLPPAEGPGARVLSAAVKLSDTTSQALREAALVEVRYFLEEYSDGPYLEDGLALAAELLVELGRPAEAARYLAAVAVSGSQSDVWAESTLRLAELYLGPLASRERAHMLLKAIVEETPDTEEADRARKLLGDE